MDFRSISTWSARQDGDVTITSGAVPAEWAQGRATFGGLVAAIAVRPMLARVPAERWMRTLNVAFVAPLAAATAECRTQVLREGRALTTVESRIVQEGKVICVATAAF